MASHEQRPQIRELSAEVIINSKEPAENCFDRLREVYAMAKAVHYECYQALQAVRQRQQELSVEELCDCIFALRESYALIDDLRKEIDKDADVKAKLVVMKWVLNPNAQDKIVAMFCNGFPDMKQRVALPKFDKDPEKYNRVMDWLGVPEDLRDRGTFLFQEGEYETEIVKLNWNGFQAYLDYCIAEGYPLPDGISQNETWQEPVVMVKRKHDLI